MSPENRWLSFAGVFCLALFSSVDIHAESSQPAHVSPRRFGFEIPAGPVVQNESERVVTVGDSGQKVVALRWATVDRDSIVMLPDGQLVARSNNTLEATSEMFVPETKDTLAQKLLATEFPGFRTKQTRRFLYVYNCSTGFAEITSRILETMFQGVSTYSQVQQIDVHEPPTPLVVVLFRTKSQFQSYRSLDDSVVAFYDVRSNRVAIYEETDFWKIKPELAIQQSLSTIAHEGAHQILHNIGVQQRLSVWPMWINEGLAEFFAPTTLDRNLKWKGAGQVNDMRMFELEQYFKTPETVQPDGQFVSQTVGAARLTSTGYAAAWALTHYLAKNQRESFHAFVRDTSGLKPLEIGGNALPPGVIPDNVRQFKKRFRNDLADVERRLILHLKQLPYRDPFLEWPHFTVLLSVPTARGTRRDEQVFHTLEQAETWRDDRLARVTAPSRETGEATIRQFPNRIVAERFAQQWVSGG